MGDKIPLRLGNIMVNCKLTEQTTVDGEFNIQIPDGVSNITLTFVDNFGQMVTTTKVHSIYL